MSLTDSQKVMRNDTGKAIADALVGIRNVLNRNAGKVLYGFHIDPTESDPAEAVTYLEDAIGMTPAYMDYTNGVFNYGSWENAFFMPRPCMLKYDGTVDYYLDPSDYSKKFDGITPSDIADDTYGGNAMMEWGQGGKKIWYKIVPDSTPTGARVYIADSKIDDDYRAWSFVNNVGEMVDHFYTPIYNGSLDSSGRLRSISGKAYSDLCQSKTAAQEIAAAELNNPSTNKLWYTEVYADITLINFLLVLMGKSLNTQAIFGNGRIYQTSAAENMLGTGTMNDKGLFYGSNGINEGVKVFGMENYWGNQWRRFAGLVMIDYVQKYKMTRTTADGSTANDYSTSDFSGYLTGGTGPNANNYVTAMEFNEDTNFVHSAGGDAASTSTYYCDYWYQNSGTRYAIRGGACNGSLNCGAWFVHLGNAASSAGWAFGAAPSCKPLS